MLDFLIVLAVLALLVSINGLYVAAEFATVAVRRPRLRQMAASGHRLAQRLLPIVDDHRKLDDYIAACQLGITASSLVLGAYGQRQLALALAPQLAALGSLAMPAALSISATLVLVVLTTLQVVLGELFPKSIAIQFRDQVATALVIPMQWSVTLFRPFIWLFNGSALLILRLFKIDAGSTHSHVHSPEEIDLLISESRKGGLVATEEQQMVHNALRFGDLTVRQAMTPRNRMFAEPADSSLASLISRVAATGMTRIPLYRGTVDNVVGFVHVKDLFRLQIQQSGQVQDVVRSVSYVPENLRIVEAWRQLRSQRGRLAVVLDEYGGTAGMVTLDDLVEQIFGELHDEYDAEAAVVPSDREGRLHLRGDLLIVDVNELLGIDLPDSAVDTLGGLVMHELERIPAVGDEIRTGAPAIAIRVEQMDGRAVAEVSLCQADGAPLTVSGGALT